MKAVLIGAGGHAQSVLDAAHSAGITIGWYLDPKLSTWLEKPGRVTEKAAGAATTISWPWPNAQWITDAELRNVASGEGAILIMGIGGVDAASLRTRLSVLDNYLKQDYRCHDVRHRTAHVSDLARLEAGVVVLAGAIVQAGAFIGRGAIINTGATVEHSSVIGAGTHVAPRAIILGGCRVGSCCMIGAGAVILPGTTIVDNSLVPAGARYPS